MNRVRRRFVSVVVASIALGWSTWVTQARADTEGLPLGIPGKDVIFLPTDATLVNGMLDLANVTAKDTLIDLGSGDGRLVIAAAQRGAQAHGIEYNPQLVERAQRDAAASGLASRATFEKADIFDSDFSRASVITLFLLPELNLRLRPTLLKMKPGTRIVSNTFEMGDWKPDRTARVQDPCPNYCAALLWTVPAQVAGTWRVGEAELVLEQSFQMLQGQWREGGQTTPISEARMDGTNIRFVAGGRRYAGVVEGGHMRGTAAGETWSATRR